MTHQIENPPTAQKQLVALPVSVRQRIDQRIRSLADDPRPQHAKRLQGKQDLFRVRVGDYRIVYTVQASRLVVVVIWV
ncbi:MAG: type II toxin-antitoxin system RelE family toxin [Acidobacteriota bacterium]